MVIEIAKSEMETQKILYISDLDGTLLNGNAELSEYTITVLNKLISSGLTFSIATARTAATTLKMFKRVALNCPIILMNGVQVFDPVSGRYIKKEHLSASIVANIIQVMRKANLTGLMYSLHGEELVTYYENLENPTLNDFISERITKYNKIFTQVADFAGISDDIIYFCFLDNQESIERIYLLISAIDGISTAMYRDIYSDTLWYLEIFSKNASKFSAVTFLRQMYGYDKIVGFGDNLNDIPLFQACDECYAVANAKDEVKAAATGIIARNDEDGVAKWLEALPADTTDAFQYGKSGRYGTICRV
jgi:Cof subfamily protein (haloacid dehalogenase superfamily)